MAFVKESEMIVNVYPPIIYHLSIKLNSLKSTYIIVNGDDNVCPCLKIHSIPNFSLKNISTNCFFSPVVLLMLYHLGYILFKIQNSNGIFKILI